jgi:hypothetical protein
VSQSAILVQDPIPDLKIDWAKTILESKSTPALQVVVTHKFFAGNRIPGYKAKPEPKEYWNLVAGMYAYLHIEAAKMGVDVIGESQLVGYPTQYPSVSMMNYNTAEPNARFWVLKLLKDNFGPGDRMIETTECSKDLAVQAFDTARGRSS